MPAPNLTALFDIESQFESAAEGILAEVLIECYKPGDDQPIPVQNARCQFDLGPAIEGEFAQLTKPSSWPDGLAPPQEYFRYNATLEFRVEVPRDNCEPTIAGVDSMLAQIRGKIREVMMQSVRPFTPENLPYYKVSRVRPDGASSGTGPKERNSDIIVQRYAITFEIRKDAWPAWVEA